MKLIIRPRDKGRTIPGQIIKGSSEPRLSAPSIPYKNKHQIQYKPSNNAFGISAERFSVIKKDIVGPGTNKINNNPENPSFSKKGFGAMASKMARTMSVGFNKGPGPSEYSNTETSFFTKSTKKRASSFTRSQTQGLFWSETANKISNPGPFQYDSIKATARTSNISTSSFKSLIKRWKQKITQFSPNPSTYHPLQNLVYKRSRGIVIQQARPLTKQNILQQYFGKQKQRNGPGQYIKQKSNIKKIKTKETSGFKFINQPIANLNKIASIIPNSGYKQFLQTSMTARKIRRNSEEKDYASALSFSKVTY